ncbi:MAG: DNA repair protein RecO [Candidatus Saccharibacteria bacterium]|nr:DNA repair protein RecO [Candidatus Saccharibacteria bacterium]
MLETKRGDLKTLAYVLRRTNYGEADRILNLITLVGKVSAIAKGVRKEKSKLAGGVEMLTRSEINLHFGKSELATVTGAKMQRFYAEILKDLKRMELATMMLKKIERAAETVETAEHFEILDKSLFALNSGENITMVESWFLMNLARAMGEQLNLYTDLDGEKLEENARYIWDENELAFRKTESGMVDANTIKIMRLMWTTELEVVARIKKAEEYMPEILKIALSL